MKNKSRHDRAHTHASGGAAGIGALQCPSVHRAASILNRWFIKPDKNWCC